MKTQALIVGARVLAGMAGVNALRKPKYRLNGRTVLVTGGSRGLGLLLACELPVAAAVLPFVPVTLRSCKKILSD
jgi:hypothetical protein